MSEVIGCFILLSVLLLIYFTPLIVAENRNHHNTLAIGVMNALLGWTLLGWAISLVWACSNSKGAN